MENASQIILTSFIGDALSLGPHWIYSQNEIADKLGPGGSYASPLSSYHPGKQAGDFTHYGDQTLVLLRSIAGSASDGLAEFSQDWRAYWEDPATISYRDGATRTTLANLQKGLPPEQAASTSHDIAGAARIAPLFLLNWENDEALMAAVHGQTHLTHGSAEVLEAAEFFARVTLAVTRGCSIPEALRATAAQKAWQAPCIRWLSAAETSSQGTLTDLAAAESLGLSCNTEEAFPTICHFLLRHPTQAAEALTLNSLAGGDSAARGLILGMIYGAQPDITLPQSWSDGLRAYAEILALCGSMKS